MKLFCFEFFSQMLEFYFSLLKNWQTFSNSFHHDFLDFAPRICFPHCQPLQMFLNPNERFFCSPRNCCSRFEFYVSTIMPLVFHHSLHAFHWYQQIWLVLCALLFLSWFALTVICIKQMIVCFQLWNQGDPRVLDATIVLSLMTNGCVCSIDGNNWQSRQDINVSHVFNIHTLWNESHECVLIKYVLV